jgi:hypothetical protein
MDFSIGIVRKLWNRWYPTRISQFVVLLTNLPSYWPFENWWEQRSRPVVIIVREVIPRRIEYINPCSKISKVRPLISPRTHHSIPTTQLVTRHLRFYYNHQHNAIRRALLGNLTRPPIDPVSLKIIAHIGTWQASDSKSWRKMFNPLER